MFENFRCKVWFKELCFVEVQETKHFYRFFKTGILQDANKQMSPLKNLPHFRQFSRAIFKIFDKKSQKYIGFGEVEVHSDCQNS